MSRTSRLTAVLVAAIALVAVLVLPGAAMARDRNHDRIPDRWEKRHHLSLTVNQANRDQDRDELRNRAEHLAGDNPRDADSDDDGVEDGDENAGTIQSFDAETGRLTIDLFGGDTVSGLVADATEIECEHSGSASASSEDEPGDDHGDNSGPGSANSGPGSREDGAGECDCSVADLVPGAVVEEAELRVANGTATFEEVELAG